MPKGPRTYGSQVGRPKKRKRKMNNFKHLQILIEKKLEKFQKELRAGTSYQKEVLIQRDIFNELLEMIKTIIRDDLTETDLKQRRKYK